MKELESQRCTRTNAFLGSVRDISGFPTLSLIDACAEAGELGSRTPLIVISELVSGALAVCDRNLTLLREITLEHFLWIYVYGDSDVFNFVLY